MIAEGETFVVDAAEVKHSGVKVVDVDILAVGEITITQFVRAAPGGAPFDAAAGEENGKGIDVMIAA